jgi:hypothetical protein
MFVLLGLLLVGSVFGAAARTRLIAIGYSDKRARRAFAGVMVGGVLGAEAVSVLVLGPTPDGIIELGLGQACLMGGVFLAVSGLFLVAARTRTFPATGPPRRTSQSASQVKIEIPRRPFMKWLIPSMVAGPGIFGFHLVQAGQWVGLAVLGALMMVVVVEYVAVDMNYRRQKAFADTDGGPVAVILLRSFVSDRISGREFAIAKAVRKRFGQFVALGNPNDETLPFGADRHYFSHDTWQVELTNMARISQVILILPDVTPSIRWELEMIRQEKLQGRFYVVQPRAHPIMFWMNFYRMLAGVRNPFNWANFAQVLSDAGFKAVPEAAPSIGFVIGFDGEGRCVELARGLQNATQLVERIAAEAAST